MSAVKQGYFSYLRVLVATCSVLSLFCAPASASDYTGIYVASDGSTVSYISVTDVGGSLTGYLQNVSADRSQTDGVRRQSVNLAGSVSGSHLVFGRLTAESTWSGLTLAFPQSSGQIGTMNYKRSSIAEVNEMIARLTADAGQQKATADAADAHARSINDASAERADAEQRLYNNLASRPTELNAIQKAKAAVKKAILDKQAAEAEVERRKGIATQARSDADAAQAAATNNEEHVAANSSEAEANSRFSDVNSAMANVNGMNATLQQATFDLSYAQAALHRTDARIAQLRGIIALDNSIISQH